VVLEEKGYWQDAGQHVIQRVSLAMFGRVADTWEDLLASFKKVAHDPTVVVHPVMKTMLGRLYEVLEQRPDGMYGVFCPDGHFRYFPPGCVALAGVDAEAPPSTIATQHKEANGEQGPSSVLAPPSAPASPPASPKAAIVPPPPLPPQGPPATSPPEKPPGASIALDCWCKPAETEREQIERVVSHYVELLRSQGVVMPDNIGLISQCNESITKHRRCWVYRFGSRRLHFAARDQNDGRLLLVVHCGGGFMDFIDFARRHGGLEQIKLEKSKQQLQGRVNVNRVLRGKNIQVSVQ